MALRVFVRRNYGGKSPLSIQCDNFHSFKGSVILLCQNIHERDQYQIYMAQRSLQCL